MDIIKDDELSSEVDKYILPVEELFNLLPEKVTVDTLLANKKIISDIAAIIRKSVIYKECISEIDKIDLFVIKNENLTENRIMHLWRDFEHYKEVGTIFEKLFYIINLIPLIEKHMSEYLSESK